MAKDDALVASTAAYPGECRSQQTSAAQTALGISVVSNSCLFRDGLLSLLGQQLNYLLVGSYGGEPSLDAVLPNPAGHIVLLDDNLGRDVTMRWLSYWCALRPPASVIVLDLANNPEHILEYIESGAAGYTLQNCSISDLAQVLQELRQGQASCSPTVTAHLFARLARLKTSLREVSGRTALTAREMEVLRALAAEMSNQEIARHLIIEVRTVKHHVHNILEKLQQRRRWDAVRYARERGWLEG